MVKLRLAPEVTPGEVAIESDSFEPLIPAAQAGSLLSRWWKVKVPNGVEKDRILAYAASNQIEVAEYENFVTPARAPSDTYYIDGEQWNVKKTRLTAAWEVRMMGARIAVLDTGVNPAHEEMTGVVDRVAFYHETTPAPCDGHATGVASVAAARTGNGAGIAGAAWMALVGSYKMLWDGPRCRGTGASSAASIAQAVADGYRIINMSYGGESFTSEQNAVTAAWNAGAFLVASAGNDPGETHPAQYANVFSVASSTQGDTQYAFSNGGDLLAPGVGIIAADLAGYASWTGTSFAAPLVAGTASLLMADGLTNAQIEQRLLNNSDGGRLNAYRALRPQQGCIRDVPVGTWVIRDNGNVYQVREANTLRFLPEITVLNSWTGANHNLVYLCEDRVGMMDISSTPWGYRPGRLVRDPANSFIYLITTDGDRGLPVKRKIANPTVYACFGWSGTAFQEGTSSSLALHPAGAEITESDCNTIFPFVPRHFPNGALIRRSSDGTIYLVEGGLKRKIPTWPIYQSWFYEGEWMPATDTELALFSDGMDLGFRHGSGSAIQPGGSPNIYAVTDDGGMRGRGSRRMFEDMGAWVERRWSSIGYIAGVTSNELALHSAGMNLRNANDMP